MIQYGESVDVNARNYWVHVVLIVYACEGVQARVCQINGVRSATQRFSMCCTWAKAAQVLSYRSRGPDVRGLGVDTGHTIGHSTVVVVLRRRTSVYIPVL